MFVCGTIVKKSQKSHLKAAERLSLIMMMAIGKAGVRFFAVRSKVGIARVRQAGHVACVNAISTDGVAERY